MNTHDDYLDPDNSGMFDEQASNDVFIQAFKDFNSLAEINRAAYKYTNCGASVGFLIHFYDETKTDIHHFPIEKTEWFYGNSLHQWGNFEDMSKGGLLILEVSVCSIVEGVDEGTQTYIVKIDPIAGDSEQINTDYSKALQAVEDEAQMIWMDTHGCGGCAKLLSLDDDCSLIPVHSDCKQCDGHGIPI